MARINSQLGSPVAGLTRMAALCAATFLAMLAICWSPSAAEEMDGAGLYRQHCASCHGGTGKGDGPLAEKLKIPPLPLTTLARRHAGTFPTKYVYRIIDGREERRAHGGRDMPVWGAYYGSLAKWQGSNAPSTETVIQERILALIEHLESIQVTYTAAAGPGATAASGRLLERHLAAFGARDIDAVMKAYSDGSVLVIPTGILEGREEIGDYYKALFADFAQTGAVLNQMEMSVVGNVAHIVWSGETPDNVYEYTAETFAVEAGKIRYQITAFKTVAR